MNKQKVVYYAHHMSTYGSAREAKDIATLEAMGFRVVNPGSKVFEGVTDMEVYEQLARSCDGVAFRSFNKDGKIGSGVWKEIVAGGLAHKFIIELPRIHNRNLSREETRARIRKGEQ